MRDAICCELFRLRARVWLAIAHVPKLNMALTLQCPDRESIRATLDAIARIGEGRFAVLSPASDKDGGAFLHRLESLLTQLPSIRGLSHGSEARLSGRQYSFPDEIATGGELLALVRTAG